MENFVMKNKYLLGVLNLVFLLGGIQSCFLADQAEKSDKPGGEDVQEAISWLNNRPNEDVKKDPKVREFFANHKVYISLTSSPKRLAKIIYVLNTLDLSLVEKVLVSIPYQFGRDGSKYEIPDAIENHEKIEIIRIEKDLGPITKLVPAVEFLKDLGEEESLVITVDDDIGYPIGMVGQIAKFFAYSSRTVFASSTRPISSWNLDGRKWPDQDETVVEGFGGIGYWVQDVDTEQMKSIAARQEEEGLGRSCFLSDDIVISFVLAGSKVRRQQIKNKYYHPNQILPFYYGLEEDALHRGAGSVENKIYEHDINEEKYRKCYHYLTKKYSS